MAEIAQALLVVMRRGSLRAAEAIFPLGALLYIAWSGFLMLATPWVFG